MPLNYAICDMANFGFLCPPPGTFLIIFFDNTSKIDYLLQKQFTDEVSLWSVIYLHILQIYVRVFALTKNLKYITYTTFALIINIFGAFQVSFDSVLNAVLVIFGQYIWPNLRAIISIITKDNQIKFWMAASESWNNRLSEVCPLFSTQMPIMAKKFA